jgi:hypothetical protein
MGLSEVLLRPFQTFFRAPILNIPISTITVPPVPFLMVITFGSFCIITSGTVFCFVRGIGMVGHVRGRDGHPVVSWMDTQGVGSQFGVEGLIAAMMFSASAASFIASIVILQKPEDEELSEIDQVMRNFAFSCPLWCLLSFWIFSAKVGSFRPSFRA